MTIAVLGVDEANLELLRRMPGHERQTFVPLLAARYGLYGAPLEAVVKCEHKYWSWLEQQQVIDELPRFGLVDLDDPRLPDGVRYPVWLKPVKSCSSELAFHVADEEQLAEAVGQIREGIGRMGRPFEWIMDQIELPPQIAGVGGAASPATTSDPPRRRGEQSVT